MNPLEEALRSAASHPATWIIVSLCVVITLALWRRRRRTTGRQYNSTLRSWILSGRGEMPELPPESKRDLKAIRRRGTKADETELVLLVDELLAEDISLAHDAQNSLEAARERALPQLLAGLDDPRALRPYDEPSHWTGSTHPVQEICRLLEALPRKLVLPHFLDRVGKASRLESGRLLPYLVSSGDPRSLAAIETITARFEGLDLGFHWDLGKKSARFLEAHRLALGELLLNYRSSKDWPLVPVALLGNQMIEHLPGSSTADIPDSLLSALHEKEVVLPREWFEEEIKVLDRALARGRLEDERLVWIFGFDQRSPDGASSERLQFALKFDDGRLESAFAEYYFSHDGFSAYVERQRELILAGNRDLEHPLNDLAQASWLDHDVNNNSFLGHFANSECVGFDASLRGLELMGAEEYAVVARAAREILFDGLETPPAPRSPEFQKLLESMLKDHEDDEEETALEFIFGVWVRLDGFNEGLSLHGRWQRAMFRLFREGVEPPEADEVSPS